MEYVIPLVLVLLLVTGFVVFLTMNSAKKSRTGDEGAVPGIGADDTPLGDTAEHAGSQTSDGRTVGGQDAEQHGGTGRAISGEGAVTTPSERFMESSGAGGGSGQQKGEAGDEQQQDDRPRSERIANRPV